MQQILPNKLIFTALIILFACMPLKIEARSLYGECITSTIENVSIVKLTPLKETCHNDCKKECEKFLYIDENKKVHNEEIKTQCIAECQRGNGFSSRYLGSEGTYESPMDIIVQSSCQENVDDNKKFAGLNVSNGSTVKIRLRPSSTAAQKIYLCGKHHIKVKPMFYFDKNFNHVLNNCSSDISSSDCKLQNILTAGMSDEEFEGLDPNNYMDDSATSFHARNPTFYNTGINVAENDEISLRWTGNNSLWDYYLLEENKEDYNTPREAIIAGYNRNDDSTELKRRFKLNSYFYLKVDNTAAYLPGENDNDLGPRLPSFDFETFGKEFFYRENYINHSAFYQWGLKAYYADKDIKLKDEGCEQGLDDPNCSITLIHPGVGDYWYNGILNKDFTDTFGNKRKPLQLRHYDGGKLTDNWGGYEIEVVHNGCPFSDGKQIQYAVLPNDKDLADFEMTWYDIPSSAFDNYLTINSADLGSYDTGALYLRINTVPPSKYDSGNLHEDHGNLHGEYELVINNASLNPTFQGKTGILTKIIYHVYFLIYNNSLLLYKNIIEDSAFIETLNILFIFFMIGTGFGFLTGTIDKSLKEVIDRTLKLGVVVFITSPATLENIFSDWLIAYIMGLLTLIWEMTSITIPNNISLNVDPIYNLPGYTGSLQPHSIFLIFDYYIDILIDGNTWKKLSGLAMSNFLNSVLVIAVVIGIILSLMTVLKLFTIFLYSIIGISLLIMILPVFSVFLLFKRTKSLFDTWWKYFFSWSLQPIAIITLVTMMVSLLIILISNALNFTVCLGKGTGPIFSFINVWVPIINSSVPDGVNLGEQSPILMQVGLIYIIFSYIAYAMIDKLSQIISSIFTGPVRSAMVSAQGGTPFALAKSGAQHTASAIKQSGAEAMQRLRDSQQSNNQ